MKTLTRIIYAVVALTSLSACSNMAVRTGCETPTLAPAQADTVGIIAVTITTTSTVGAYLCYTTDGTTPTDGSSPHGKVIKAQTGKVLVPCVFGRTLKLQAIAFKPGVCVSPVAVGTYRGH